MLAVSRAVAGVIDCACGGVRISSARDDGRGARWRAARAARVVSAAVLALAPGFYALDEARTPMRVSVLSIGVNYALNWLFVRVLGFGATRLALSTSLVALANCVILLILLRRRLGPLGGRLGGALARTGVATALMLVAAATVDAVLAGHLPARPLLHHGFRVALVVPVAVAAFWGARPSLGIPMPALRRRVPSG